MFSWRWQSLAQRLKSSSDLQQGKKDKRLSMPHTCAVCFRKLDPIVYKQMFLCNLIGLSDPDTMLLQDFILRQRKIK